MKKMKLNPLKLDKQTIALLNDNQLQEVVGGINHQLIAPGSTGCGSGASTCSSGGSTGCGSGGSGCFIN
ncbi:conserved hypothetical protein [Tenacibaculum sp. 190524A02b]|uniref:Uncharacterized protein n=1 Tax=Tenacibaculum vairaonense TaxID=3137860 RepID=A0ABP1FHW0_9FLAO